MARLTDAEKTEICRRREKDPFDIAVCKNELDLNYDYQIAVHKGEFTGTFDDYKKSLGLGVQTWVLPFKGEEANNVKQPKKKKGLVIGIGIGFLVLVAVGIYLVKKNK